MKYSLLQRGNPIIFNAELAVAIGLNEAIVLQKIVYLLDRTESGRLLKHDGERWLFNTYESWQEQFFPFLSVMTVQRTFVDLERKGLLVSCQPEGGISRRKYYRLGEGAACHLVSERLDEEVKLTSSGRHQNDMIDESKRCLPLTGNTTEKTTDTKTGADAHCELKKFVPPSPEQVEAYSQEIGYPLNGQAWCDSYQQKGWMVGKSKMKDWRAAVRNWKSQGWLPTNTQNNVVSREEHVTRV